MKNLASGENNFGDVHEELLTTMLPSSKSVTSSLEYFSLVFCVK